MIEWREPTLRDITTKIGSGATPRGGKGSYAEVGVSLIRSMNVLDAHFERSGLAHINCEQANQLDHVKVEQGDVLVNITGASVARSCIAPSWVLPARVNQHVAIVRLDQTQALPGFVNAYLVSPEGKGRLLGLAAGGATREALTKATLESFTIRLPPLDIQRRVSEILGALDDLIENDHRRIEALEQTAQAIYREWFVHFRYPGHERAPVQSSLSLLPKGWQTTTLGEAAQWLSGGTPSTRIPEYWDGDIPWITSGTLTSLLLDRSERMVTRSGVENGTRLVERDTLLFVVRGMSLVKEFRVGIADVPLTFGQDCKALIAKPGIRPLFLAFSVISMADEIQGMVELAGHGTGKLSTDRLKAITIPHPPEQLQVDFEAIVSPLRESSTRLRCSTDKLDGIRGLLLPRLVTGRLDLSCLDLDALVSP